jgi:hypothetical protein
MVLSLIYACKDTTFSQNSRVFRVKFHKIPGIFVLDFTKFQGFLMEISQNSKKMPPQKKDVVGVGIS